MQKKTNRIRQMLKSIDASSAENESEENTHHQTDIEAGQPGQRLDDGFGFCGLLHSDDTAAVEDHDNRRAEDDGKYHNRILSLWLDWCIIEGSPSHYIMPTKRTFIKAKKKARPTPTGAFRAMGLIHLFDPFLQLRSLLMGIHVIPTGRSCRSAFCSYPDVQYHAIVDSDNLLHRGVPLAIRSVAVRPVAEEIIKVDHGTDGFHGRKMKGVARTRTWSLDHNRVNRDTFDRTATCCMCVLPP